MDRPLDLTREDSGTQEAPIAYCAATGAEVRISGGRAISHFDAVTEATVLSRLDVAARDHVRVADLRALGLTNYGAPDGGGVELFFNDEPMPISRWPNTGFIHITEVRALRRCEPRLLAREAHRSPGESGGTNAVMRGAGRYPHYQS